MVGTISRIWAGCCRLKLAMPLPLSNIPLGTNVHNVELTPGRGGQIVRAAGTTAQVVAERWQLCDPEASFN